MIQLHDRTRRQLCLAAFGLFCLLPTILVVGWCVRRHLPGCAAEEARELAAQLGLEVKIAAIQYLRPGAVLYEGVELADPETRQTIFRCRLLEIGRAQRTSEQGRHRPTLSLIASQPRLEGAAVGRSWQWLQDLLQNQLGRLDYDIQLSAADMTLQAAEGSQTLTGVDGLIEALPEGTLAQFRFRLVGADTPEPIGITVARNRQISPPASGFELDTGDGELPCNLLAMGVGELRSLGPRCRFRGRISATERSDGWEGEIKGQFVELNLGNLVTGRFPNRLSGIAELKIPSALFRKGRLEEGSAVLVAGPGTIARSLVDAAIEHLGLVPGAARLPQRPRIEYGRLTMIVQLNGQGLHIGGWRQSLDPSTVLCDGAILCDKDDRPLLGEPRQQWQPLAALVRTLVPESTVQVPACLQADWLLRHSPVPDVIPPSVAEPALPASRPRAGDTWQR